MNKELNAMKFLINQGFSISINGNGDYEAVDQKERFPDQNNVFTSTPWSSLATYVRRSLVEFYEKEVKKHNEAIDLMNQILEQSINTVNALKNRSNWTDQD